METNNEFELSNKVEHVGLGDKLQESFEKELPSLTEMTRKSPQNKTLKGDR